MVGTYGVGRMTRVDGTQARAWRARGLCGAALAALLAGCSSGSPSINPVTWWHDLQGGEIAKQRPPPPGASDPYPNLATVPNHPPAADPALRQQIENQLVADRTSAREVAAASPLPDPSSPTASPALFGRGSLPPPAPEEGAATASLNAATAPPAAARPNPAAPSVTIPAAPSTPPPPPTPEPSPVSHPPSRAPIAAVQSTPLAAPAAPPAAPSAAPPAPPAPVSLPVPAPAPAPPEDPATLPALPTAPPPAAVLPGVPPVPSSTPRAAQAIRVQPIRPAVTRASAPSGGLSAAPVMDLAFTPGSASLPPDALARLQGLASRRGVAVLAVTGYGDATSDDPGVQSQALALGLSRAQAVASALGAAGVPPAGLRVDAEARGQGAVVRLVE